MLANLSVRNFRQQTIVDGANQFSIGFCKIPLKGESDLANKLLIRWRIRSSWQSVSWNRLVWENRCKTHYDNKDLLVICRRVAKRIYRRKLGS